MGGKKGGKGRGGREDGAGATSIVILWWYKTV